MFAFGALPAIVLGLGIAVLPESPRWLLLHRHKEEAIKVLRRIRGTQDVMPEVNEILEHADPGRGKAADLFSPTVLPVLLCGIVLAVIQQITAINTVIYYAPTIFQASTLNSNAPAIIPPPAVRSVKC